MVDGRPRRLHVFGKGMLDTLDDVFWMLPFSSKKQSHIVRQENGLTDEDWLKRRDLITAEHRIEGARDQLRTQWKAWINQDAFKASSQAASRAPAGDSTIPEFDE
jgi:hypothetical protein